MGPPFAYTPGEYTFKASAMASVDPRPYHHDHHFHAGNTTAERNTKWIVVITAAMMVVEIVGGYLLNSMAIHEELVHVTVEAVQA